MQDSWKEGLTLVRATVVEVSSVTSEGESQSWDWLVKLKQLQFNHKIKALGIISKHQTIERIYLNPNKSRVILVNGFVGLFGFCTG